MGIPGFNVWFSETYKSSYVTLKDVGQVDHVYIDLNSVLHSTLRCAPTLDRFFVKLYSKLDEVLRVMQPRKTVMLAVDGPAPLAKLLTQRSRRKATATKSERDKAIGNKKRKTAMSSTALTPGTPFLYDTCLALAYYACNRLQAGKYRHLQFEISGATVQGEGEVKILGRLARPWLHVAPGDSHVILGDDADLVLMALVGSTDNLYVVNASLNDGDLELGMPAFSVDIFHRHVVEAFVHPEAVFPGGLSQKWLCAKADLALLAIMCSGNDYLPCVRGMNMQALWAAYKRLRGGAAWGHRSIVVVSEDGSVRLDTALLAELLKDRTHRSHTAREPMAHQPLPDAEQYLKGAVWTMQMYIAGRCPDYRYTYPGGRPCAPDILQVLRRQQCIALDTFPGLQPVSEEPLLPHACAMALLPAASVDLAPSGLRHLMQEGSPLYELYHDCPTCLQLAAEASAAGRHIAQLVKQLEHLRAQLTRAAGAGYEEELAQQLQEVGVAKEEAGQASKEVDQRRVAHLRQFHPYKPFPLEQLLQVLAAIPDEAHPPEELPLTRFGRSYMFRNTSYGSRSASPPPAAAAAAAAPFHRSYSSSSGGRLAGYVPPPPPVPRFYDSFDSARLCVAREVLVEVGGRVALVADDEAPVHKYLALA